MATTHLTLLPMNFFAWWSLAALWCDVDEVACSASVLFWKDRFAVDSFCSDLA